MRLEGHFGRIIGVGSAGFKIVERIAERNPELSPILAIDTEPREKRIPASIRYFTLGTGTRPRPFHRLPPEWARQAVMDDQEYLKKELAGNGPAVVVAGLGGGVATGAAPAVARLCRSIGAFTVAVVSLPFPFEGPGRIRSAEEGIVSIKSHSDATLLIRYEHILRMVPPSTRLYEIYEVANEIFSLAIESNLKFFSRHAASIHTPVSNG